jgi:hypothetical protein
MPIKFSTKSTFDVVLTADKDLPAEEQAVFVCRCLSVAEWLDVAELDEKFAKLDNARERMDAAEQIVKKGICGWRNLLDKEAQKEIPFAIEELRSILTLSEFIELMHCVVLQRPGFDDKKKLGSPSDSNTEQSAQAAKE